MSLRLLAASICLGAALATGAGGAAAQEATPAGSAEKLRIPLPAYDGTLTPYSFERAYPLMTLVYDTLLWRDEEGRPQPWLGQDLKRSDDGRTLTLTLRDGARWHDGRPLTASDVAFTFRYFRERYHPRFTPQLTAVETVRAEGARTVVIELSSPSLGAADQPLSDVPIIPEHLWGDLPAGEEEPAGLPVGSGPYRLTAANADSGYRFEANEEYFLGAPAVSPIRVPIIETPDETLAAIRSRQVDMLPISLPPRLLTEIESFGIAAAKGPLYGGTALLLNTRRPPFDDAAIRRAVSESLDLTRVARGVQGAEPAEGGYIHPDSEWAPDEQIHRLDEMAAREQLHDGVLGEVAVLAPKSDPVRLEAGRQVVLALQRAGAAAELRELTSEQLDRAIGVDASTPDFQAAISPIPALTSYDPDFLAAVFGSEASEAPLNYTGFADPAFDSLAAEVQDEGDPARRRELIADELRLLTRESPAIPLFYSDGAFPYRPAIYDGWIFVKGTGILDKRSFLASPDEGAGEVELGIEPSEPPPRIGVAGWLAIVLLIGAGGLAAWTVARARRA